MEFVRLDNKKTIFETLRLFDLIFPNLKTRNPDYSKYAEKLSKYAEVYQVENSGEIIGFLAFYSNNHMNKVGYITSIGLFEPYRRNGFGSGMLKFAEMNMISKGMEYSRLEVNKENKYAILFYQFNGYTLDGESDTGKYMIKKLCQE